MKWRVDIEYEDGSFTEPRRIAFQAVYDGEPYHGYDTKKEALEAFCVGQVAMREMLKEREAEQKKEDGWDKAIKEAKEVAKAYEYFPRLKICGEQKKGEEKEVKVDMSEETRKRLEKLAPMSVIKIGWKAKAETSPYDGSITSVSFREVVDGYPTKKEALIAFVEEQKEAEGNKEWKHFVEATDEQKKKADELKEQTSNILHNDLRGGNSHWELKEEDCILPSKKEKPVFYSKTFPPTIEERIDLLERYLGISKAKMKQTVSTLFVEQDNRLEKIEQRLTEIEGVLTSIGSPDYDLRKKVEGLEKGLAQLTDTFYICANNETHNYEDLRKKVEELEKRLRNY